MVINFVIFFCIRLSSLCSEINLLPLPIVLLFHSSSSPPVSCCIKAFSWLWTGASPAGPLHFAHMAQGKIFLQWSDKVVFLFPVAGIQDQHKVENESHRTVIKALFSWVTAHRSATGKSFFPAVPWDCDWTQIPQNVTENVYILATISNLYYTWLFISSTEISESQLERENPDGKRFLPNEEHSVTSDRYLLKPVITFVVSEVRERRKGLAVICLLQGIFCSGEEQKDFPPPGVVLGDSTKEMQLRNPFKSVCDCLHTGC